MGEPGSNFAHSQDCLTSVPHMGFNIAKTQVYWTWCSAAFTSTGFSKITLKYKVKQIFKWFLDWTRPQHFTVCSTTQTGILLKITNHRTKPQHASGYIKNSLKRDLFLQLGRGKNDILALSPKASEAAKFPEVPDNLKAWQARLS